MDGATPGVIRTRCIYTLDSLIVRWSLHTISYNAVSPASTSKYFPSPQTSKYGYTDHADLFILYGADINVQNIVSNTPLHVGATHDQV